MPRFVMTRIKIGTRTIKVHEVGPDKPTAQVRLEKKAAREWHDIVKEEAANA